LQERRKEDIVEVFQGMIIELLRSKRMEAENYLKGGEWQYFKDALS
jgi:hypothetical protein